MPKQPKATKATTKAQATKAQATTPTHPAALAVQATGATVAPPVHKVPVASAKRTTNVAQGGATALVWCLCNAWATQTGLQGTGPVPLAIAHQLCTNVPRATVAKLGLWPNTPGTTTPVQGTASTVATNTIITQVGQYNTWATGGTPTQGPPKRFKVTPGFVRGSK